MSELMSDTFEEAYERRARRERTSKGPNIKGMLENKGGRCSGRTVARQYLPDLHVVSTPFHLQSP